MDAPGAVWGQSSPMLRSIDFAGRDARARARAREPAPTSNPHPPSRLYRNQEYRLHSFAKFNELLETGELSDYTLYVGQVEKEFKVHKLILSRNSGYFRKVCYVEPDIPERDCDESRGIHRLKGFDTDQIEFVLHWLYTGTLSPRLVQFTHHEMQYLLVYADYFEVPSLTSELHVNLQPFLKAYIRNWWTTLLTSCGTPQEPTNNEIYTAIDTLVEKLLVTTNKWVKDTVFHEMVWVVGVTDERLWKGMRRLLLREYKTVDKEDRTRISKDLFEAESYAKGQRVNNRRVGGENVI